MSDDPDHARSLAEQLRLAEENDNLPDELADKLDQEEDDQEEDDQEENDGE
ncbi:hypothetical protein [Halorubrum halophilum]|uniref:hypothetical protein n=1 Tax=Halorubrum halophilum TaxID=413816 RepID=UPI000AA96E09|nr:hypothetical protein [Halorubrum halophilum]